MSDIPVKIVKTLSVILTRDKQDIVDYNLDTYANATNYAIKTIFKRHLASPRAAYDALYADIRDRFVYNKEVDAEEADGKIVFGGRFPFAIISRIIGESDKNPVELLQEFTERFAHQYVSDVIKTASVEITRYRKLSKMIVSMRNKIPHFKQGVMIVSGFLVNIDTGGATLLTLGGQEVPIPFDKRSRNREIDILEQIASGKRKIQRVRFTRNREGYLNIDIRLPES
ncbi:MAG: hypothetical protein P1Q69_08245 [Candidatus Thorarchaeota archaeon]|nr:hypothetical protein [Candidatus Thorarchaeota archaeon]